MNIALSIAVASQLGSPFVMPVGDRVPIIDVQKSCKETAATNKAMDLDLAQSVSNCLRDENAAKLQLIGVWSTYSASIRDRCEQEAAIPGSASYVDMLTCVQLNVSSTISSTPDPSGASTTQNGN